ncbi:hypothetical protein PMZ80_005917 [Knufia obscura]|uniref:Methyltransferase type 12 domain-containing protein n=2 Tax=Knufia TaxID=430999 RepID=A0AAN8I4V3_9EURO|nr:hypothetical protein PMZ80_005917 [Knufia obscura]KAK5954587.1 hypothetical protein OHC33_004309 [Knufia fluminis]
MVHQAEAMGDHDHRRHHHNHNAHGMSHDDRNKSHWDSVAKTYNSEKSQREFGNLINKAHEFILSNISAIGVDFIEPSSTFEKPNDQSPQKTIRVLDYACGPGTITNILAGRATEFIGLDLSPNMVTEYNERFSTETDGEKLNAQAFNANLFDPAGEPESLNDPKFFDFDLVAVGFGFHHFENLSTVTQRLVRRLKPGGVLMILDFFSHDMDDKARDHPSANTIAHHGFTESQIKGLFASVGLEDNLVLDFGQDVTMQGHATRRPFMARGRKPA